MLASYRDEKSDVNDLNKSVVSYFHICINWERKSFKVTVQISDEKAEVVPSSESVSVMFPGSSGARTSASPVRTRRGISTTEPDQWAGGNFGYSTPIFSGFISAHRKQFLSHEQQASTEANVTGKKRT